MPFASWSTFEAVAVTRAHWIEGKLRLPPETATAAYLNLENKAFLPLEDVRVFPGGYRRQGEAILEAGFLAVAKRQLLWIAGGKPMRPPAGIVVRRRAAVFFSDHVLVGEVETLKSLDLAAFFSRAGAFATLFSAGVYPLPGFGEGRAPEARFDFLTVHLGGIEGVLEFERADAHPRWGGLY